MSVYWVDPWKDTPGTGTYDDPYSPYIYNVNFPACLIGGVDEYRIKSRLKSELIRECFTATSSAYNDNCNDSSAGEVYSLSKCLANDPDYANFNKWFFINPVTNFTVSSQSNYGSPNYDVNNNTLGINQHDVFPLSNIESSNGIVVGILKSECVPSRLVCDNSINILGSNPSNCSPISLNDYDQLQITDGWISENVRCTNGDAISIWSGDNPNRILLSHKTGQTDFCNSLVLNIKYDLKNSIFLYTGANYGYFNLYFPYANNSDPNYIPNYKQNNNFDICLGTTFGRYYYNLAGIQLGINDNTGIGDLPNIRNYVINCKTNNTPINRNVNIHLRYYTNAWGMLGTFLNYQEMCNNFNLNIECLGIIQTYGASISTNMCNKEYLTSYNLNIGEFNYWAAHTCGYLSHQPDSVLPDKITIDKIYTQTYYNRSKSHSSNTHLLSYGINLTGQSGGGTHGNYISTSSEMHFPTLNNIISKFDQLPLNNFMDKDKTIIMDVKPTLINYYDYTKTNFVSDYNIIKYVNLSQLYITSNPVLIPKNKNKNKATILSYSFENVTLDNTFINYVSHTPGFEYKYNYDSIGLLNITYYQKNSENFVIGIPGKEFSWEQTLIGVPSANGTNPNLISIRFTDVNYLTGFTGSFDFNHPSVSGSHYPLNYSFNPRVYALNVPFYKLNTVTVTGMYKIGQHAESTVSAIKLVSASNESILTNLHKTDGLFHSFSISYTPMQDEIGQFHFIMDALTHDFTGTTYAKSDFELIDLEVTYG